MTFYDVQSLLKRNKMIVNARPHSWHTIRRFAQETDARIYLEELRVGAKEAKLPYSYRTKTVQATY